MATVILKGADFSDNNIGQISLPREMNEFTKKIFSHCTKYSIYSEQVSLIDDFINYLDDEGLLEHLGLFMAPWLASNVDEATYNIAGDTQLQYDEGVTLSNGVLKTDNLAHRVVVGNNVVPAVNFIGSICSDIIPSWLHTFTSAADNNKMSIALGPSNSTIISKSLNFNAQFGYKFDTADWSGAKISLFNIKGLSNLDSNGTTVNGISVTPNTGYEKSSSEPLPSPNGFSHIIPSRASQDIKEILIAGDGTNLTDAQVTSMMTAMNTLQEGLAALEE